MSVVATSRSMIFTSCRQFRYHIVIVVVVVVVVIIITIKSSYAHLPFSYNSRLSNSTLCRSVPERKRAMRKKSSVEQSAVVRGDQ